MIDIMDAARYLVYLSYYQKRASLTSLKLQKLLYLAQGWSYVWDNKPLFCNEFEAWQYGPVNVDGRDEIPASEAEQYEFDNDTKETLEAIWEEFGSYSAFQLVEITHCQEPWKDAYLANATIKNSNIKEYFQSTYC